MDYDFENDYLGYSDYAIEAIRNHTPITDLHLTSTGISDLTPLQELSDTLTELDLSNNNEIIDLTPLAKLQRLTEIDLSGTSVQDLSPLTSIKNLQRVYLDATPVTDLSPLAELPNLKALGIQRTAIPDLSPLANIKSLEAIYLARAARINLPPLKGLERLTNVELAHTGVANLSALEGAKSLESLDLSGCDMIADLAPLAGMKGLKHLHLDGTKFEGVPLEDVIAGNVSPAPQIERGAPLDRPHGPEQITDRLQREIANDDYTSLGAELEASGQAAFIAGTRFVLVQRDGEQHYSAAILDPNLSPAQSADKLFQRDGAAGISALKRAAEIAFDDQLANHATSPIRIDPENLRAAKRRNDETTIEKAANELESDGCTALNIRNELDGINEYWHVARDGQGGYHAARYDGYVEQCSFTNKQQAFQHICRQINLADPNVSIQTVNSDIMRSMMLGLIERHDPFAQSIEKPQGQAIPHAIVEKINGDTWRPGMPKAGWLVRYGISDAHGFMYQRCFADREGAEKFAAEKTTEAEKAAAKSPADIAMGKLFPKADAKAQEKGQGKTQGRSI